MQHTKTFEAFISEKLTAKNPNDEVTVDVDMAYDNPRDAAIVFKKFNVKVKEIKGGQGTEHEVTGKKKDVLAYLQSEWYEMDDDTVKQYYPELLEGNELDEASVQVAGKSKPAGAKVLATVIIDHMMKENYLKPGADAAREPLINDIAKLIMDSTF
jgi:hypothetical protein